MELGSLWLISGVFLLAGVVKGVVGLGLPTVAMALLGLFMEPVEAAILMIVPSLLTNVWQASAGRHFRSLLLRLWLPLGGIAVGTLVTIGLLVSETWATSSVMLGGALLCYGLIGLARVPLRVPRRAEGIAGVVTGLSTGMITGATGVFVFPVVPYLSALALSRDELVQALGLTFTVATVVLAAALAVRGELAVTGLGASTMALAPAVAGMVLGARVRTRVSPGIFRAAFFCALAVLGAELVWRGFR